MSQLKTQANDNSVDAFVVGVVDSARRTDCLIAREMMESQGGEPARMWGRR